MPKVVRRDSRLRSIQQRPLRGCGSLFPFRVLSNIELPRFRERFRTTGIGASQKFATKNRAFLLCFYLLKKPYTRRCAVCTAGMPAASSGQMALRHTRQSTYCCFRQDLTGFMASCCTGSTPQHYLPVPYTAQGSPRPGIPPRYSGLRVQGTANSPPSTAFSLYRTFPQSATTSRVFKKS